MAEKVRSEIYNSLTGMKKEFHDHLDIAWALSSDQRNILLESLPTLIRARTERERLVARQITAEKIGGSELDTLKAIDVMHFIGSTWNPIRDNVESVMEDFEDLGLLPTETQLKSEAVQFLQSYFEFLQRDSKRVLDKATSRGYLPSINRIDVAIDLRSVVESEFDWINDNPDDYSPIINRAVPVAILKIIRTEGDPVLLQSNKDDLETIIRQLQAALKEIDASKNLLK
jgi:hypothetical protein